MSDAIKFHAAIKTRRYGRIVLMENPDGIFLRRDGDIVWSTLGENWRDRALRAENDLGRLMADIDRSMKAATERRVAGAAPITVGVMRRLEAIEKKLRDAAIAIEAVSKAIPGINRLEGDDSIVLSVCVGSVDNCVHLTLGHLKDIAALKETLPE